MATTWQLFMLQQFDSQIDELNQILANMDRGQALEEEKQQLLQKQQELSEQHKQNQIQIKDRELKLQSLITQKKNVEKKLFEGANPKELEGWQKELQNLTQQVDALETEVLAELEGVDTFKNNQAELESQIKQKDHLIKQKVDNLENEIAAIKAQIAECQEKREKMAAQIEMPILKKYEDLREKKGGIAVVKVNKVNCGGCYMNLPLPLLNKVKSRSVEFCNSCGRILHPESQD